MKNNFFQKSVSSIRQLQNLANLEFQVDSELKTSFMAEWAQAVMSLQENSVWLDNQWSHSRDLR